LANVKPAEVPAEPTDAVKALIKQLQDPEVRTRRQAAESLMKLKDRSAVPALVARVSDDYWGNGDGDYAAYSSKQMALEALHSLEATWVTSALVAASARERTQEVRNWACRELRNQKDRQALSALVAALKDDAEQVRRMSAASLASFGKFGVEALIMALTDSTVSVRRQAAESLWNLGDRTKPPPEVAQAVLKLAAAPLAARVADDRWGTGDGDYESYSSKLMALIALRRIDPSRSTPALVSATAKERPMDVRRWACRELGNQKDAEAAVSGLVAALKDEAAEVRVTSAASLKSFGMLAVEPLIGALTDSAVGVRRQAAESLWTLADRTKQTPEVAQHVQKLASVPLAARVADNRWGTGDRDYESYSSKLMALIALRRIDPNSATPALTKALTAASEEVRIWACNQLVQQKEDAATTALAAAATNDKSPQVREAASRALGEKKK
jgi:HEAT repeat protein